MPTVGAASAETSGAGAASLGPAGIDGLFAGSIVVSGRSTDASSESDFLRREKRAIVSA